MLNTHRLRMVRDSLGLTQEAIAKVLNMHPQTIWHWEKGNQNPSRPNLHRLAGVLRVDPNYLLGVTDDPKPKFRHENVNHPAETPSSAMLSDAPQFEIEDNQESPSQLEKLSEFGDFVRIKAAETFRVRAERIVVEIRITI